MKVIICGSGQVGSSIATQLSKENNDVTLIDIDPDIIKNINQNHDVHGLVGHASHPDTLERAGAEKADMIIAATPSDEVNMVTCQVAHTIFKIPKKIARIRSMVYRDPLWINLFGHNHMPIDVIISPEYEVAQSIYERLSVPSASSVMTFENDIMRVVGVMCDENCPLIHTPIKHFDDLFPDTSFKIVCIVHKEKVFIPEKDDQIYPEDEVYFVTASENTSRVMAFFGHEDLKARRVLIIGGGSIGTHIARMIHERSAHIQVTIIEQNKSRAYDISSQLGDHVTVLRGDGLSKEILEEAMIEKTESVLMITDDDKTNILGGLIAKRYGAGHVISLINKVAYSDIVHNIGLDTIVNPRVITVATILRYVRRGRVKAVRRLRQDDAEIIELEATESSKIINTPIKDIKLPPHAIICCLFRKQTMLIPKAEDEIRVGDKVILIDVGKQADEIGNLFAPTKQYF